MSRQADQWRRQAACRGCDPSLFFPTTDGPEHRDEIAAAKAVCARCSVQQECLDYALAARQTLGIYGGLTPTERRKLRRSVPVHA